MKYEYIFLIIIGICLTTMGWFGNVVYQDYQNSKLPSKSYNGLWIPTNNLTKSQAIKTALDYDTYGNWVCVNIDRMSIQQMVETCEHEVGHEIFAQKCAKNFTKCVETIK